MTGRTGQHKVGNKPGAKGNAGNVAQKHSATNGKSGKVATKASPLGANHAPKSLAVKGATFHPGAKVAAGTPIRTAAGTFRAGHFSKPAAAVIPGRNAPARSAFVHPGAAITSSNYPRPHYGNTYITNNTTVIENNYRYDSRVYAPHVANFYGYNDPVWGNHWRYGCYSSPGISVSFGFGFYAYTPYYTAVVASPWYYYPCVPAYVPQDRVVVLSGYDCNWNDGDDFAYTSDNDPDFYQATTAVVGIYANGAYGGFGVLLEPDAPVAVFCEGHYQYSLDPDDFRATFTDTCRATHTIGYRILGCRRFNWGGQPGYLVYAHHRFSSPSGGEEDVYQTYRMHRGFSGHYVVSDFNTSHRPMHFR